MGSNPTLAVGVQKKGIVETTTEVLYNIPLGEIWADEDWNTRGYITPASVSSLADDIELRGQLQPIVVRPFVNEERGTKFKILMGHRRYEAMSLLSRKDPVKFGVVQAKIDERDISETEALLVNLKENLERVDLNIVQEARGIARFREKWGWDARRISKELVKPKKWVDIRLGLLKLPKEVQDRAASGYLSQYEIEKCIELDTNEQVFDYVRNIVDHKLRGKKIEAKKPGGPKRKTLISVMVKGETRTMVEMALVQESIQDSFKDHKHPAAMALAWACGVISYEEFISAHVMKWAEAADVLFHDHPQIIAKAEGK